MSTLLLLAMILTGSPQSASAQDGSEKNPFADADMEPAYQARCHEVRELTQGRETPSRRLDLAVTGSLALVHFDGTLAYLGLCGTEPDPKVLCITYSTNDMKVGDMVTVTGGYSRPGADFIVLDPCLAQPASPAE